MKHTVTIIILLTAMLFPLRAAAELPRSLQEAIDTLDHHLSLREIYIARRHKAINDLKQEMDIANTQDPTLKYEALGNAFRGYMVDSAMYYFTKGVESARIHGHKQLEWRLALLNAEAMTFYGLFKEAIEYYENTDTTELDTASLKLYHRTGINIYLQAYAFYPEPYKETYREKAIHSLKATIPYYRSGSVASDLTNAQIKILNGENALSLADLTHIFPHMEMSKPEFAITASHIADFYKRLPSRHDDYMYYLALSATGDLISATCETTALQRLGIELYRKGDTGRAYKYLVAAWENNFISGARIHAIDNDKIIAQINKETRQDEKKRSSRMVAALVIAFVAISYLTFTIFKKRALAGRQTQQIASMAQSNRQKDTYIRQLLSLCSVYIESLEYFNKLTARKLKAGQWQDLYQIAESGKILQDSADKFHAVFDEAFLNIFPTFIEDLNTLLLPDKKISLQSHRTLTPELRVTAFMRIGVDDSTQISKFLGLSLNTVYTYRNRMKARATDRENFETNIHKIGNFD